MTALTNQQKQAALRARHAATGQKEMRGIYLTEAEEMVIKKMVRAKLKRIRK